MLDKHKVFEPAMSPDLHETTSKHGEAGRGDFTTETAIPQSTENSIRKKKKSKKKNKLEVALSVDNIDEGPSSAVTAATGNGTRVDSEPLGNTMDRILENSYALATQTQGMGDFKAEDMSKKTNFEDILTGTAPRGRYQKDIASYKFWSTQPVAKFDEEEARRPDGPVREKNPEVVPPHGAELLDGFEWATMDLDDEKQLSEIYELLSAHYVEDSEAMFRFNYSATFLNWALKSPGWIPEWHVGVRVITSQKLVAFISGVPVNLKVRANIVRCSEINFLCIHKKLRSKRLAPVLIKEITRRCNVEKVWNAIYTAGIILPKPISTCRYYHRSLDWLKLYEVGFNPLPLNSTKARQVTKYRLPTRTNIRGLREMEPKDLNAVHDLLSRYLERFDMAPKFDKEEVEHWLLHKESGLGGRVVFTYVVEDNGRVTDFFSFYALESTVIGSKKHELIRAAYLFYYASEVAFKKSSDMKKELGMRLNTLVNDALIIAKKFEFDVFNALTLLDNTLFLQEQKFGAGDGQLHYYLFNWRTACIEGGINESSNIDEKNGSGSGIGIVML